MSVHRRTAIATAFLLLVATPLAADKGKRAIKFAHDQSPETLDPYFTSTRIGVLLREHIWDTLVYRDPTTGAYRGHLASAWRQIDDRTLEFDLRPDVKFHNGEEFDADDVVHTINFVAKPDNKVLAQANVSWLEGAEKVSKYQVRIKTKNIFPAAIEYLSGPIVILPNEYAERNGPKAQGDRPVGTGPYRATQYTMGKGVTLERNPSHFSGSQKGRAQHIDRVDIRFLPDRQTQIAEMLSGNLDLMTNVPQDQANQLKDMPQLGVLGGETMRVALIQMNAQAQSAFPALKDVRVRRAINHAIDREALARNLVGQGARVLDTPCFPAQFGCTDEGARKYPYDPAEARRLLAEAGYAGGLDLPIIGYRDRNQTEAIIGYLRAVGIRANLNFLQYPTLRDQIRTNQAALIHQTHGSYSVNDVSAGPLSNFFTLEAEDMVRDEAIRDLVSKGGASVDPETRKAAYREALLRIADNAYNAPLYTLPVFYVFRKGLNVTAYPDEILRFWEMKWE